MYTRLVSFVMIIIEENFSQTMLLTNLSKFTFLQKSVPFPLYLLPVKILAFDSNFILRKVHVQNVKLFQNPIFTI